MVLFNHATREMTAKIVYYGPGLGGKTTNLLVIYDMLDTKSKGKMLSLATRSDRTLFFDLLPVDIGKLGSFNLKIQLYTVPGQVFYNETRKLVLRGADSVVFVADSQPSMLDSNRESFENLLENLRDNQIDPLKLPIIVQLNKRDIPGVLSVEELRSQLGLEEYPFVEASALKGEGVMETFRLVSRITAKHLLSRMKGKMGESGADIDATLRVTPPQPAAPVAPAVEESEKVSIETPNADSTDDPVISDEPDAVSDGEAAPFDTDYDRMEEVSLDQLLEGRDRPLTLSTPPKTRSEDEEVEELGADDLFLDVPSPGSNELIGETADSLALEMQSEIESLQSQMALLRSEHQEILDTIARTLQDLTNLIRSRIGNS